MQKIVRCYHWFRQEQNVPDHLDSLVSSAEMNLQLDAKLAKYPQGYNQFHFTGRIIVFLWASTIDIAIIFEVSTSL